MQFLGSGRERRVQVAMLIAALSSAWGAAVSTQAQDTDPFYLRKNGAFYHYPRENSTTFASLTARIEAGYYTERGVHTLAIYCPYRASDPWRGVPALDFFATNPDTGSVADFKAMTSAAHARGMSVIVYMGLLFVDYQSALWLKAERDHESGVSSLEEATFRWADQPGTEVAEFGAWEYSEVARSYFATSWDHPALDLGGAAGQTLVKQVLSFWLDQGVDGFEYDAPGGFWGATPALLKQILSDHPNAHGSGPKYLIGEGHFANPNNELENDQAGFTHVLLSGDDDQNSVAWEAIRGELSLDELEAHFAHYIDRRRAAGRGVKSVSLYTEMSAEERALEAALLAGNGSHMEIEYDTNYARLAAEQQRQYDAVLKALASSEAEAPGAGRERLTTGSSDTGYAVLRTSRGGTERAINVYNLTRSPATVSIIVANHGLGEGDSSFDLVKQSAGPAVRNGQLSVELPALGYAFLRFGGGASPDAGAGASPDAGAGAAHDAGSAADAGGNAGAPVDAGGDALAVMSDASAPGGVRIDAGTRRDASGPPGSRGDPDAPSADEGAEGAEAERSAGSGGCATRSPLPRTSGVALIGLLLWTLRRLRNKDTPAFGTRTFAITVLQPSQVGGSTLGPTKTTYNDDIITGWVGVGSQIDGLGHIGIDNLYFNCNQAADFTMPDGLKKLGIEQVPAVATRGVLLDMAAYFGNEIVKEGTAFNRAEIEGAMKRQGIKAIEKGDVVLFYTGWLKLLGKENKRFLSVNPGLGRDGARYLASLEVAMIGADTSSFEVIPFEKDAGVFEVHQILLARNGIHILENINTEEMVKDQAWEFLFTLGPARITGGVQAIINPIAIK